MGNYVRAIFFILVVVFFITLGIKNNQAVYLNFFGMPPIALPLYALVYISILVGILGGMAVGVGSRLRLKRTVRSLEKENRTLKKKEMQPESKGVSPEQPPEAMSETD